MSTKEAPAIAAVLREAAVRAAETGRRVVIEMECEDANRSQEVALIEAIAAKGLVRLGSVAAGGIIYAGDEESLAGLAEAIAGGRPKVLSLVANAVARRATSSVDESLLNDFGSITCECVFHPDPDGDGRAAMSDEQWAEWCAFVEVLGGEVPLDRHAVGSLTFGPVRLAVGTIEKAREFRGLRHIRNMPRLGLRNSVTEFQER